MTMAAHFPPWLTAFLVASFVAGCSSRPAVDPLPSADSSGTASAASATAAPAPVASSSSAPTAAASASATASAKRLTPADAGYWESYEQPPLVDPPVARDAKECPFHPFDRAVAVTSETQHIRRGFHAYDQYGENGIAERKPLTKAQMDKAVALAKKVEGTIEVSKCPFPRHAVILMDGDRGIASINVCFECGDILVWPDYRLKDPSAKQPYDSPAVQARMKRQLRAYDAVFPEWTAFFKDELKLPIDKLVDHQMFQPGK